MAGVHRGIVYDLTSFLSIHGAIHSPKGTTSPGGNDSPLQDVFLSHFERDDTKKIDAPDIAGVHHRKVDNQRWPQRSFSAFILHVHPARFVCHDDLRHLFRVHRLYRRPLHSHVPEDRDKLVICQIPVLLKKLCHCLTIESLIQIRQKTNTSSPSSLSVLWSLVPGTTSVRFVSCLMFSVSPPMSALNLPCPWVRYSKRRARPSRADMRLVVPCIVVVTCGKLSTESRPGACMTLRGWSTKYVRSGLCDPRQMLMCFFRYQFLCSG